MKSVNEKITISEPTIGNALIRIRGLAPYVQHKFSKKASDKMIATHEAGSQARSKRVREARDFEADFRGAMHVSTEGWHGIPAPAFRNAMIRACSLVDIKMVMAKMSVFIQHNGIDEDGTPLVRITHGEPKPNMSYVRNASGVVDLRCRPMWEEWEAVVHVKWDKAQFSGTDIFNLLARAGIQVGIGEGRPSSKDSAGCGWGTFEVIPEDA